MVTVQGLSLYFGSLSIIRGDSTEYKSLRNVDLPIKVVYTEAWLLKSVWMWVWVCARAWRVGTGNGWWCFPRDDTECRGCRQLATTVLLEGEKSSKVHFKFTVNTSF